MRWKDDYLFWIGTGLRMLVGALAVALIPTTGGEQSLADWAISGLLPWHDSAPGRSAAAFPWGAPGVIVMWPFIAAGTSAGGEIGARVALLLLSFALDVATLRLIVGLVVPHDRRRLVAIYWLSPLTLFFVYFQASLAMASVVLLVALFVALATRRYVWSAVAMGAAAATVPLLVILLPLFGLYFYGRGLRRDLTPRVVAIAVATMILFTLPPALDPGFRAMVLLGRAVIEPVTTAIETSSQPRLYLFPIVYGYLLFASWRIQRLDRDMLLGLSGIALTVCLVLAPRSAVWACLVVPVLAIHAARSESTGLFMYGTLSVATVLLHALDLAGVIDLQVLTPDPAASLLATVIVITAIALCVQMARRGIVRSHFYQATRRPIAIGIGGDSGSGKDTLVASVADMIGERAAAHVSGDDYHLWDRNKPMWRALTHLDPRANDLVRFQLNISKLVDRRYIDAPHYDHANGRMTKPLRTHPAEIVIASGLHTFWSPSLRALFDISIFLDINEDLRRFLKIRRDTMVRGHLLDRVISSLDRRSADREQFILPQAAHAQIVMRLEPRFADRLGDYANQGAPALRLVVTAQPGIAFGDLTRMLVSVASILTVERHDAAGRTELMIEGEPTADEIGSAGRRLNPELADFLPTSPRWHSGLAGVMQLVILTQIDRVTINRWGGA